MRPFRVYDSDLDEEFPDQGMYAAAYEPVWQSIRMDCLDKWSTLPTARLCCARLQVYMDHSRKGNDRSVRIWRVFNLLNAIPYNKVNEYGIHSIEYPATDYILEYRESVRTLYRNTPYATEWDWAISRRGLKVMWRRNPDWMRYLLRWLVNRPLRNRIKPELTYYTAMNLEIMNLLPEGDL